MGLWEQLEKIDRRHVFVVALIALSLPLIFPQIQVGGITVSPMTRGFKAQLDNVESGDYVFIETLFSAMHYTELSMMLDMIFENMIRQGAKIVHITRPGASLIMENFVFPKLADFGGVYGENYMNFGVLAGGSMGKIAFAQDPRRLIATDWYGNNIEEISMLSSIFEEMDETGKPFIKFFKLAISFGITLDIMWLIAIPYRLPTISATTTQFVMVIISYYPFVLKGLLQGTRGAAELEALYGKIGIGTAYASSLSLVFTVYFALLVITNVIYWRKRLMERGGK